MEIKDIEKIRDTFCSTEVTPYSDGYANMILTADEVYVIKRSLEARIEWIESETEVNDEETHLASALDKLNSLNFNVIIPKTNAKVKEDEDGK